MHKSQPMWHPSNSIMSRRGNDFRVNVTTALSGKAAATFKDVTPLGEGSVRTDSWWAPHLGSEHIYITSLWKVLQYTGCPGPRNYNVYSTITDITDSAKMVDSTISFSQLTQRISRVCCLALLLKDGSVRSRSGGWAANSGADIEKENGTFGNNSSGNPKRKNIDILFSLAERPFGRSVCQQ